MTKAEGTRAVKAALRSAGMGSYRAQSESCCGGVRTAVRGEPELILEALSRLPGVERFSGNESLVVVHWERVA